MLHEAYTGAEVDYRVISPRSINQERIGHFGFFKPHQEKALWPLVGEWLDRHS
jgi:predicted alpha/beta hydrolase